MVIVGNEVGPTNLHWHRILLCANQAEDECLCFGEKETGSHYASKLALKLIWRDPSGWALRKTLTVVVEK